MTTHHLIPAALQLKLQPNVQVALLMFAASAALAATLASVRQVPGLSPIQVAFFRYLIGVALFLPWLMYRGGAFPRTAYIGRHIFRAAAGFAGLVCIFFAVRMMPLAEATSFGFTAPLFVLLGGAMVLGEFVSGRRWFAALLGFCGMLVILRPGTEGIAIASAIALLGAILRATASLTAKTLTRTEGAATNVFYFTVLVTPVAFCASIPVWTMPVAADWPWLVLIACLATLAQWLLMRAMCLADASFVLPFEYSQLVFAALLGLAFFSEIPSIFTIAGSLIIFGSALLSAGEQRPALSSPR